MFLFGCMSAETSVLAAGVAILGWIYVALTSYGQYRHFIDALTGGAFGAMIGGFAGAGMHLLFTVVGRIYNAISPEP